MYATRYFYLFIYLSKLRILILLRIRVQANLKHSTKHSVLVVVSVVYAKKKKKHHYMKDTAFIDFILVTQAENLVHTLSLSDGIYP